MITEKQKENIRKILAVKIETDEDYLRFLELTSIESRSTFRGQHFSGKQQRSTLKSGKKR